MAFWRIRDGKFVFTCNDGSINTNNDSSSGIVN